MVRRSVAEAARAIGGEVLPAGDPAAAAARFDGAAIDSRRVRGGELFFALPGARTDGHRFVGPALAAGAAAAVVARPVEAPAVPRPILVRVADPFAALHDLVRAVRRQVPERLVAITGSTGKTTTKDLLAAMLARRFRVARSPGNLNNLYGFPVALLGIPDDTEWMVAEMGMSTPGELAAISRLGRPDVALFTNVRPVHLEFFADLAAIAAAKEELLAGLVPGGRVVANADDPQVAAIARRFLARQGAGGEGVDPGDPDGAHDGEVAPAGRVLWYGHAGGPGARSGIRLDLAASAVTPAPAGEVGSRFVLATPGPPGAGERRAVALPLHGLYNVDNCLAAAACAWALGVPLDEIVAAAAAAAPAEHRGEVHRLAGGAVLVDDAYNSNPDALARALEGAAALALGAPGAGGRRWAVLGDMLELGPEAPRFHREAGEAAARRGFSPVAGVGELARALVAGAAAVGGTETAWFADAGAAAAWAAGRLGPGDVVLVKGSRGVGLEAVVARLLAAAAPRSGGEAEG
jgi:UDP-N-acetylmuramoyl-tripeptide--D-alanyl-D-alanine ligase